MTTINYMIIAWLRLQRRWTTSTSTLQVFLDVEIPKLPIEKAVAAVRLRGRVRNDLNLQQPPGRWVQNNMKLLDFAAAFVMTLMCIRLNKLRWLHTKYFCTLCNDLKPIAPHHSKPPYTKWSKQPLVRQSRTSAVTHRIGHHRAPHV